MRRVPWGALLALALLTATPAAAATSSWIETLGGHISIGYVKLIPDTTKSPGGSISLSAGLDYPVARTVRVGLDLGYDLLGSNNYEVGSQFATVDYSALELIGFVHWLPTRLGPVRRLSAGPMLINAHGDLSVAAGGAAFENRAVHETAGGAAVQATLMPGWNSPVRPGLELGWRRGFMPGEDWTLLSLRVTVQY